MSYSWRGGSTRRWRRIRLRVLIRDNWTCRIRLEGCTGRATDAHHTLGLRISGDDERYIVAACASCNGKLGDPSRTNPQPRSATHW